MFFDILMCSPKCVTQDIRFEHNIHNISPLLHSKSYLWAGKPLEIPPFSIFKNDCLVTYWAHFCRFFLCLTYGTWVVTNFLFSWATYPYWNPWRSYTSTRYENMPYWISQCDLCKYIFLVLRSNTRGVIGGLAPLLTFWGIYIKVLPNFISKVQEH